MWMATYDGGLAATLYGPCTVSALVGQKTPVKLSCDTAYPFEETIRIAIEPEQEATFPLYFRLPAWCAKPQISVNGSAIDATPERQRLCHGSNGRGSEATPCCFRFRCRLPWPAAMSANIRRRSKSYFGNRPSANYDKRRLPYETVSYGPLLFALPIPDKDPNTPVPDAKWQYALDNEAERKGGDITGGAEADAADVGLAAGCADCTVGSGDGVRLAPDRGPGAAQCNRGRHRRGNDPPCALRLHEVSDLDVPRDGQSLEETVIGIRFPLNEQTSRGTRLASRGTLGSSHNETQGGAAWTSPVSRNGRRRGNLGRGHPALSRQRPLDTGILHS